MHLQEELSNFARTSGAIDFFGVADLAPAREFVHRQSEGLLPDLPLAISIGIRLPDAVVDLLPHRKQNAVKVSYRTHAYEVINRRLDQAASELGSVLQSKGFQAFPVAASERTDNEKICAIFSHKLAANLSGLGWIGKNCLVVTPSHGPRVRWATVLTNAPLEPTGQPLQDQCGDCSACVDICPVQAFSGRHFHPEEPRELRYHAEKCDAYFKAMESRGEPKVCGMCLYACPFGAGQTPAAPVFEGGGGQ